MMPGGVVVGWVSDIFGGRRACVIAVFMAFLAPLLWFFALYSDVMNPILLLFLLCVMGILVGGPNNIITSAVAADLADDPSIGGNTRSLGTVTGIINGSGSITAALLDAHRPTAGHWRLDCRLVLPHCLCRWAP